MTDVLARRSFRSLATPEAVDAVHGQLDALWDGCRRSFPTWTG